jgi:hypothetical protein
VVHHEYAAEESGLHGYMHLATDHHTRRSRVLSCRRIQWPPLLPNRTSFSGIVGEPICDQLRVLDGMLENKSASLVLIE